jgi:hypothetical protein
MNPNQQPAELDQILLEHDVLVPSSGFAASVMDAIHQEMSVPAPISFPWKRAIPGFAALLAGLLMLERLLAITLEEMSHHPAASADLLHWLQSSAEPAVILRTQAAPALLALAASFVCVMICRKFASGWSAE